MDGWRRRAGRGPGVRRTAERAGQEGNYQESEAE